MTEKRFTTDNGSHEDVCLVDNLTKKEYESNFEDMVSLMNDIWNQTQRFEKHNQRLEKENEQLKKDATTLIYANQDYRQQNQNLQKQLDYIQNSITNAIKHQKTELGQKALQEIIADYNEWMLGHKEAKE